MHASLLALHSALRARQTLAAVSFRTGRPPFHTSTAAVALGRTHSGPISPPVCRDSLHQELHAAGSRAFCHVPAPRGARDTAPPVSVQTTGRQTEHSSTEASLAICSADCDQSRQVNPYQFGSLPCMWRALMWLHLHWYDRPSRQWLCRLHDRLLHHNPSVPGYGAAASSISPPELTRRWLSAM